jgi:hypothetical protein
MIICDVCWCIMGQSDEYEDVLDKSVFWIGRNCICKECYNIYCKIVDEDRLDESKRKN